MAGRPEQSLNSPMSLSAIATQSPAARSAFSRSENAMADLLGESSNHFDDLFKDLEDWEAILSAMPDFGVDQKSARMGNTGPGIEVDS